MTFFLYETSIPNSLSFCGLITREGMDLTTELTYFLSCSNLTQEYLIGQFQMGKEGL